MIGSLIVMFLFLFVLTFAGGAALAQLFWTPPTKDNL